MNGKNQQKIGFKPARNRTGYALTEYLETNPDFVALLTRVKGEDQLPACIRMRSATKRRASKSKIQ